MAQRRVLSVEEVQDRLDGLPGWELRDGRLRRELQFDDFIAAFGFMTQVALIAETQNHHPDWSNSYGRVVIELRTHDLGGITEWDFRLAEAANRLLGE